MTVNQALSQLKESEENLKLGIINKDSKFIGLARIGAPDQLIISGTLEELIEFDFGNPLHSVILVGKMHSMEEEMFDYYNVKNKLN